MTDFKFPGVYTIKSPSGRLYVGSSADIQTRWVWHRNALIRGGHHNRALQAAYCKYGELNFTVVEKCKVAELIEREQAHIDSYPFAHLYNFAQTADSPTRGVRFSAEHRAKIARAATGRKHSDKARKRISEVQKGKTLSEACREKMSAVRRGRPRPYLPTGPSGMRGVYKANSKWMARVDIKGRRIVIGRYLTAQEAGIARAAYLEGLNGD